MAVADTLTEQHRRAQLALRATTLKQLLRLWPAFDVENIPGTWPAFEEALLLLVQARGSNSSGLATAYYRRVRHAAEVTGRATPVAVGVATDRVLAGMRIVGPVAAAKQLALGRPVDDVARATLVNVSGEATRHVLNAGRNTVTASIWADSQALGYQRVTGGNPCSFCAMAASRGAVFKEETAYFESHAHCACSAEPLYIGDQPSRARERAQEFRSMWNDATQGLSGAEARRAFRRSYEGR